MEAAAAPKPKPRTMASILAEWPSLARYWRVLAREGRLPDPDTVTVYCTAPPPGYAIPPTAGGAALPGEGLVWFRECPPHPAIFIHEAIHLAEKRPPASAAVEPSEEYYAHNGTATIIALERLGILDQTEGNPLRLLEELTIDLIRDEYARWRASGAPRYIGAPQPHCLTEELLYNGILVPIPSPGPASGPCEAEASARGTGYEYYTAWLIWLHAAGTPATAEVAARIALRLLGGGKGQHA